MNTLKLDNLEMIEGFNLNLTELNEKEMRTIDGGIVITLGVAVAMGILFVGSTALGFAVGSRVW